MSWQVYLSYRRAVPTKRGATSPETRSVEHGEVHPFDLEADAQDFALKARAATRSWSPAGAYDHDVSDPIETYNTTRKAHA